MTRRYCKIENVSIINRKFLLHRVTFSIKLLIFEFRKRNRASSTNEKIVTLSARYVRALLYSRPRYETKTKENPILHCHGQYHRKDTFTLHRHRERIALNGKTTRMEISRSAKARRLLVHRLTDSHCSLVTWPRLTLKLIQSVALLPGGEIRDDPETSRQTLVKQQRALSLDTKGDRTEEKRRDETGRERIARRRGAGRH